MYEYRWTGPGGPPLVLRLSEGLGVAAADRTDARRFQLLLGLSTATGKRPRTDQRKKCEGDGLRLRSCQLPPLCEREWLIGSLRDDLNQ